MLRVVRGRVACVPVGVSSTLYMCMHMPVHMPMSMSVRRSPCLLPVGYAYAYAYACAYAYAYTYKCAALSLPVAAYVYAYAVGRNPSSAAGNHNNKIEQLTD